MLIYLMLLHYVYFFLAQIMQGSAGTLVGGHFQLCLSCKRSTQYQKTYSVVQTEAWPERFHNHTREGFGSLKMQKHQTEGSDLCAGKRVP